MQEALIRALASWPAAPPADPKGWLITAAWRRYLDATRADNARRSREIRVETAAGIIVPRLEDDGQVTVDMGPPRFEPAEIPFVADRRATLSVRCRSAVGRSGSG